MRQAVHPKIWQLWLIYKITHNKPKWVFYMLYLGRGTPIFANYSRFSGKAPGGGVFIFASLNLNQEKTPPLETRFHWLWVNYATNTKSDTWNLRKAPGGDVFIFASLAKKDPTKFHPLGLFPRINLEKSTLAAHLKVRLYLKSID